MTSYVYRDVVADDRHQGMGGMGGMGMMNPMMMGGMGGMGYVSRPLFDAVP